MGYIIVSNLPKLFFAIKLPFKHNIFKLIKIGTALFYALYGRSYRKHLQKCHTHLVSLIKNHGLFGKRISDDCVRPSYNVNMAWYR